MPLLNFHPLRFYNPHNNVACYVSPCIPVGQYTFAHLHTRIEGLGCERDEAKPVQSVAGQSQSRCRCGGGEPSPGADVAGVSPGSTGAGMNGMARAKLTVHKPNIVGAIGQVCHSIRACDPCACFRLSAGSVDRGRCVSMCVCVCGVGA